jgi:spermidine synthase
LGQREAWRQERDIWSETLQKFSEKYDVIIADLRDIKAKITGKE